jgi:Protein of unknown function (DUF3305)
MSVIAPLQSIAVGVVVERTKAASSWSEFLWRPLGVLVGAPDTLPWTKLSDDGERTTFFAGTATIELHRSETTNYRGNLTNGEPLLWVVLRPSEAEMPYALLMVTADPAEGEAMTEAGNDLVETVPMPKAIQQAVADFVAEHHVEQTFAKRKRDRADPEALGRRLSRDDEQL